MKFTNWDRSCILGIIFLAFYTIGVFNLLNTNAPVDLIVNSPAWNRALEEEVEIQNEARSDVIDAIIPGTYNTERSISQGDLGLNYVYETAYPIKLLFRPDYLISFIGSDIVGFYLKSLFRLSVAGIGMFFFLRLFITSRIAIMFGAITYMLSGFHSAWIYWPHVGVTIWMPWIFWAGYRLYSSNRPIRYTVLLTLFCTFAIYAWFPSVAAYVFYGLGVWWILNLISGKSSVSGFERSILMACGVGLSILISSVLLFEKKLILFDTHNVVEERINYGGSALEWEDLLLFFNPQRFGEPFPEISMFVGRVAVVLVLLILPFRIKSLWKSTGTRQLLLFSFILMLVSFVIGWELINREIIRLIPTFSFNPWHRITILLTFGMAVLSSLVMASINVSRFERMNQIGITIFLLGLVVVQFGDLKHHFRDYNGVYKTDYWYPVTPTISHMKENIGSNQKIMADNSYFVPGTLRYYGLEDWFAHGRKTKLFRDYLSKLVRDPHATNTAASYTFGDISTFGSPFFDIFCIKYITSAFTNDVLSFYPEFWKGESISVNLKNERNVTLNYTPKKELEVHSFGAVLGTYYDDFYLNQKFTINISSENWDTTIHYDNTVYNNETHIFPLNGPIVLENGSKYLLTLSYYGGSDLAIWAENRQNPKLAFNVKKDLSIHGWEKINQEDHVILLENKEVPEGIYYVDDINVVDRDLDSKGLVLNAIGSQDYSFTVKGPLAEAKWVVLAIKDRLHYQLKGNSDHEIEMRRYMGIFPALLISEPGTYILENKPPLKGFSWMLSVFGLLILLFLIFFGKKIDNWMNTRNIKSAI